MRRIGLIGGVSWQATAAYYRVLNEAVEALIGPPHSADLALRSVDFAEIIAQIDQPDRIEAEFAAAIADVAAAGADFVAIASVTAHAYLPAELPVGFVHIADPLSEALERFKTQRVGLIGTSFALAHQPLWRTVRETHELLPIAPPVAAELDRFIMAGFRPSAYHDVALWLAKAVDGLGTQGADVVLLACTELSLVADTLPSDHRVIDATSVHCAALAGRAVATSRVRMPA